MNLIRNENMKIYKRKRTWVMVAFVIVYVLIQIINLKTAEDTDFGKDWRTKLEQENISLSKELEKSNTLIIEDKQAKKKLLLNQYYLENNIPPDTNAWSFAVGQISNIIFAVSLIAIIIGGEIVAAEFGSGTIKLLLTQSASRTKIYFAKYTAAILFGLFLTLVGILTAILFSSFIFGLDGLGGNYFFVKDQTVIGVPILQALIGSYLLNIPFLFLAITLAFMISAAFRSTTFSIVISILVTLVGFILSIAMNGWNWTKYFVFSHTDLNQFIFGTPSVEGMTLGLSVGFIILHLLILHLISYPIFVKRDVA